MKISPEIQKELTQMNFFVRWICRIAMRSPYWHLDGYMERWWLIKERWIRIGKWEYQLPAIRLHRILRSDDDRHLHDHPRNCISCILYGSYIETVPFIQSQHYSTDSYMLIDYVRKPFRLIYRPAKNRHRLTLNNGVVYSLFITWGRRREWGFATPEGWIHHKVYDKETP